MLFPSLSLSLSPSPHHFCLGLPLLLLSASAAFRSFTSLVPTLGAREVKRRGNSGERVGQRRDKAMGKGGEGKSEKGGKSRAE